MTAGEVKGRHARKYFPIDLLIGVVHYPSMGNMSVMIPWGSLWPVRRGVVKLLKVMDVIEGEERVDRAKRVDVWRLGTTISPVNTPVAPLRLGLFGHHHHHHCL